MESYSNIIPNPEPAVTLTLPKKTGGVPKGAYQFLEHYCTEPGCDCRRVVLVVVNEKQKQKAVINFGFDQDSPFSGPYLDNAQSQAPYAHDLLEFFVRDLNAGEPWLPRLYRHYVEVREKVEHKGYAGKPFPKPGELTYHATEPPDLAAEIEQSLRNLKGGGWSPSPIRAKAPTVVAGREKDISAGKGGAAGLASFVEQYVEAGIGEDTNRFLEIQDELRQYLFASNFAEEELASLLPSLYRQSPQPDEQIQGALRMLFDTLQILDNEIESGRPNARRIMEGLQKALARHVYQDNEDPDLCAAVANVLVHSRVEILPVLAGNSLRTMPCAGRSDLDEPAAEGVVSGILRSFHSLGITSPFEGAQELLELFTLSDVEIQTALIGELFEAEDPLLREVSALMIFHPEPEVQRSASGMLASLDGARITPETLRRLIISRNWFEDRIRRDVDQAIVNARRARVECARINRLPDASIYASSMDAVGEQTFQVVVPDGSAFAGCKMVLKQADGVRSCSVTALNSQYQADESLKKLKKDPAFLESSAEHLDLRVCNALAAGLAAGKAPSHWLVRVAELLGRDRWRAISFDPARELLLMQEDLAAVDRRLLDDKVYTDTVENSGDLYDSAPFLNSWSVDDEDVARETEASGKGKTVDIAAAADRLVDGMEKRRELWIERLVVTALWLKSTPKPPVKWHRVFHLAQAAADETVPFKDIPLMVSIAQASLRAHLSNKGHAPQKLQEVK